MLSQFSWYDKSMSLESINQDVIATFVPAKGKRFRIQTLFLPMAIFVIYSMIIPLVIIDLSVSWYQLVYFSVMGIPKIKKKDYIRMERWDLKKLTLWQKVNCVYCEYANGILAFAKAVGNQTEVYSCAIKHHHALKDHEYEKKYYSEKRFQ